MKTTLLALLFCFGASAFGCAATTHGGVARLPQSDAEDIARAKVPRGTVERSKLGWQYSKLVWNLEVSSPDTTDVTELQIDAVTGEIVSMDKVRAAKRLTEKREASR